VNRCRRRPSKAVFALALVANATLLIAGPARASTPSPIYGVTLDRIGNLTRVVAAERALPERPTSRVYFDVSEPASHYAKAVSELHTVSAVMGELLDSSDATLITTSQYQSRVESYLGVLGSSVDIWEIGNEVNGNWTGSYSTGAAKVQEAFADVAAAGGHSALTLYANEYAPDNCGDGTSELTPVQYSEQYVPESVRDGLSYVFESYYPTQCEDTYPTNDQVTAEMDQLRALYPNALLGFGEVGLPRRAKARTLSTAAQVMSWAYGLHPDTPGYVGGYFWWYAFEDVFTGKQLLAPDLSRAFEAEAASLG
jgi:hypothetical protein